MSELATDEANVRRAAAILLTACLVALVAIWLLNTSLYTSRSQFARAKEAFEQRASMLDRLRTFREGGADFYKQLIMVLAENGWASKSEYEQSEPFKAEKQQAASFAGEAVELNKSEPDADIREKTISDKFKKAFPRLPYAKNLLAILAGKVTPKTWYVVAYWIIYNESAEWLDHFDIDTIGVSYLNRSGKVWRDADQKNFLFTRLRYEGEKNAEAILSAEFVDAAKRISEAPKMVNQIGLSGIGMAVSIGDALYLIPIVLVALAGHFYIVRSASTTHGSPSFPQYQSPNDPMLFLGRLGTSDVVQRILWGGFLVFPLVIIVLGLVLRYDVATPLWYSLNPLAFLHTVIQLRSDSYVDAILDTVNLLAAILIIVYLHACTAPSDTPNVLIRNWSRPTRAGIVVVGLIALVITSQRLYRAGHFRHTYLHWYCVGTVWIFAVALLATTAIAAVRGRKFIGILSVILLIALMFSLLSEADLKVNY